MIHQWMKEVTRALLTVYGELPKDNFQITIKRSSSRISPVPWGHVERGKLTNIFAGGVSFNDNAPLAGIRQQINQQQKR